MRLYLVSPVVAANSDETAARSRLNQCIEQIADLISNHLEADPTLFGVRHVRETSDAPIQPETSYGEVEVVRIADRDLLRAILRETGDPYSGKFMVIRSLATCRAVLYGFDGQAYVCLPTEAEPIKSPDDSVIAVEECSNLLIETDWMDGLSFD